MCDAQLQCVHLTGGHTLKESSVSLFLQLSVITNSSLSGGTSWPCDFSVMGSGLARTWAGLCAVSQPLWVRVCNCPAMSKTHFHYRHPPPLSLTIFFSLPSSEMIPEPWEKEACYKCPTYLCNLLKKDTIARSSFSAEVEELHYQWCNVNSLGFALALCPFRRVIVGSFPLWPMTCLA